MVSLVNNDLSDWLLLDHLNFLLVSILDGAVISIAHHNVEVGVIFIVDDSHDLVVVAEGIIRWVLVVLNS